MAEAVVLAEHLERDITWPEPPEFGPGLVSRPRLVDRLLNAEQPTLAVITAPAGYGRTTLLAEWAEREPRPVEWLTLDDADDRDPTRLAAAIMTVFRARTPVALVLDDVHVLRSHSARNVLSMLAERLPARSRVVLSSRTAPPLPLARLRAQRTLLELGPRDLAMTAPEVAELFATEGVRASRGAVENLHRHTDGWPAAIYLAIRSQREHGDTPGVRGIVADPALREYVTESVISELPEPAIQVLAATSILDELSGPLCDAVLEREGSGRILDELARRWLLLTPTDRAGTGYRCANVLREALAEEFERADPGRVADLRRRAVEWYVDHDDPARAIDQALAGGDRDRVGELLWEHAPALVAKGGRRAVRRWLDGLTEQHRCADPRLALVNAYLAFAEGDLDAVQRWDASAHRRLHEGRPLPDAEGLRAAAAAVHATIAGDGLTSVAERMPAVRSGLVEDSPWHPVCCFVEGSALYLLGATDRAECVLEEGARRAAMVAPAAHALCLTGIALLALDRHDWQHASLATTRARAQVEHYGLGEYPTSALVFAAAAETRARMGRPDESQADARQAVRLLGSLDSFAPWFVAEVRLVLARALLRMGDAASARELLADSRRAARRDPDARLLADGLAQTEAEVAVAVEVALPREASLTSAELRVLRFLPTHLSLREIAARLCVSGNTVKTQAHAVYRKLDASSRSEAVSRAVELGLVEM